MSSKDNNHPSGEGRDPSTPITWGDLDELARQIEERMLRAPMSRAATMRRRERPADHPSDPIEAAVANERDDDGGSQ